MRFVLPILMLPLAAFAQQFDLLEGDTQLTRAEVQALTIGHTLSFYEGGTSRYSAGGAYSFSYASGATAYGHFEIDAQGKICINYENGRARCDRFVRSHGRVVMLTEDGGRYPVRP